MCLPYCIRSVHAASSILHCLLNHIHLSEKWCLWMCSAYKSATDEGFSFYPAALITAHFLSPSVKWTERSQIASVVVLALSMGWNKVHMRFLWASSIGLLSSYTKLSAGEKFKQKISYPVFSPTDRDLTKWVPRCLKQPLAMNQATFLLWGSSHTCISSSGGIQADR